MKTFKEFCQSMAAAYDWGTPKAANHAIKMTPNAVKQEKKKKKKTS